MSESTTQYIGFRVKAERDEDIREWWNAMPNGERSHVLRTLIRAYLAGEIVVTSRGEKPSEFSRSVQLAQLQTEARWIKRALLDLPSYLEDLIGGLSVAPVMSPSPPSIPPPPREPEEKPITQQGAANRAQQIADRGW